MSDPNQLRVCDACTDVALHTPTDVHHFIARLAECLRFKGGEGVLQLFFFCSSIMCDATVVNVIASVRCSQFKVFSPSYCSCAYMI